MDNNKDIIIKRVTSSKEFMGFICEDNKVIVHAPTSLRFSDDDKTKKQEIFRFIQTINIAKTNEYKNLYGDSETNKSLWDLEAYFWIIQDYISNGLYYVRDKKHVIDNKGKVNWKKTMKLQPIVSSGNIIYDKLVVTKNIIASDDITEVYKYCLNLVIKRIGWLFNYQFNEPIRKRMTVLEMKHVVRKLQKETFVDNTKIRLSYLMRILEDCGDSDHNSKKHTYGVYHYYYVFEKMVDRMYGNIYDKTDYNPPTHWHFANGSKKNAPLEPDTLYEDNNNIFIIDSKMYQHVSSMESDALPGSQSIQKQITYGKYIKEKHEYSSIRNAFVLPYNKEKNSFNLHDDVAYFGYATADWSKEEKEDYEYIIGMFIDLKYLIDHYKGSTLEELNKMYNTINDELKNIKVNK